MDWKKVAGIWACCIPLSVFPGAMGCMLTGDGRSPEGAQDGGARVRLLLSPGALVRGEAQATPAIDSAHIRITAADIAPLEFSFSGEALVFVLDGLPAGTDRLIEAHLFRRGRLLYAGKGVFPFLLESRSDAALRCDPRFSRVTARFHLPADLSPPVSQGELKLSGPAGQFTSSLHLSGEFGSFMVDEVPGDARYDVAMVLTDSLGKVRFRSERTGVFLPLGEESKWDMSLLPTEALAGLSISLGTAKESRVEAGFPSRRRLPLREGEIVISEFYAAPVDGDSASQGEWWELFNRSQDTLELRGCRLARDRGQGVTRSYGFDSSAALAPGKALVFGRAAARADVHYSDFSLVNTASPLLLLCAGDSLTVDSLRYSSVAADTGALPMREGMVTSLGSESLGRRGSRAAWCLTRMAADPASGNPASGTPVSGAASPGRMEACGEER